MSGVDQIDSYSSTLFQSRLQFKMSGQSGSSFAAEFQKGVAEYAVQHSTEEAAQKYQLDLTTVQNWRCRLENGEFKREDPPHQVRKTARCLFGAPTDNNGVLEDFDKRNSQQYAAFVQRYTIVDQISTETKADGVEVTTFKAIQNEV